MPDDHITVYAEFEPVQYPIIIANTPHGRITANSSQNAMGARITLKVEPDNGYRYKANSLYYQDSTGTAHPIGKTLQFTMPKGPITIGADFIPFSAMQNLKINNRSLISVVDAKTDYTVRIPAQDKDAAFTFTTVAGAVAKPENNTSHTLTLFENKPVQYIIEDPDGVTKTTYTFTMIKELVPTETVPAGSFWLGNGGPTMTLTKPYRIGVYEITEEEWARVIEGSSSTTTSRLPKSQITWYDALKFCNRLSILEKKTPVYSYKGNTDGSSWPTPPATVYTAPLPIEIDPNANGYRVPTEMEWLWAAMAADKLAAGALNKKGYDYTYAGAPGGRDMGDVAWYGSNSNSSRHQVGLKDPNGLGLFDMSGNVGEWCLDWYDNGISNEKIPEGKDYTGPSSGLLRVVRGGGYNTPAYRIFFAYRGEQEASSPHKAPSLSTDDIGMRILCPVN
jgi:formylglycine-generating enzyme required for sulfatase activity